MVSSTRAEPDLPARREDWLDVAKGISIVSVVLFHAGSLASGHNQAGRYWGLIDLALFTFIMPLFFLVSGMFVSKSLPLPWPAYLRARVWPMTYLFLLWSGIFAVLHTATDGGLGDTL